MRNWKQTYSNEYGFLKVEDDTKQIQALQERWETNLGKQVKEYFLDLIKNPTSYSDSQKPFWEKLPFWRETHSFIDFRGINLSGQEFQGFDVDELTGIDFSYANLNSCKFTNSFFWVLIAHKASFNQACFDNVSLSMPLLSNCSFHNSEFHKLSIFGESSSIENTSFANSVFDQCEITIYPRFSGTLQPFSYGFWDHIDFSKSNIESSQLIFDNGDISESMDANCKSRVNRYRPVNHHQQRVAVEELYATHPHLKNYLHYIKHTNLDFTNTKIIGSKLQFLKGKWNQLIFRDAKLKDVDWDGKTAKEVLTEIVNNPGQLFGLLGADFSGAHLINNNLQHMYLQNASFKNAQLEQTDFRYSKLDEVDFTNTKFKNVKGIPLKTKWLGKKK